MLLILLLLPSLLLLLFLRWPRPPCCVLRFGERGSLRLLFPSLPSLLLLPLLLRLLPWLRPLLPATDRGGCVLLVAGSSQTAPAASAFRCKTCSSETSRSECDLRRTVHVVAVGSTRASSMRVKSFLHAA